MFPVTTLESSDEITRAFVARCTDLTGIRAGCCHAVGGTWRYLSQTITEVQSGKVTKPFGEAPSGYITYSKGGRLQTIMVGDGREKPAVPMKDEDRVRLFNSFLAATGTYKVDGNNLAITYDTSWNELWTGTTQKRTFEIKGDRLTITSAPSKNASGNEVFFTVVLEKVE